MRFGKVKKMFEDGNVCVVGLRGRGKDMLMANIIARRGLPYVSNINYHPKGKKGLKAKFEPFRLTDIECGKNTYDNFINGNVHYYEYPYPDDTDIYLSDCGVYFPAQYCNELNKKYPYVPTFGALSRHFGVNFHFNVQNLGRTWDKLRELGDFFVLCNKCIVLGSVVLQKITIYDQYDSCARRVPPFKDKLPLFAKKEMKNLLEIEKMKYTLQYGDINSGWLLYVNKSDYDTRYFKEMMKNGKKYEKTN